MTAIEIDEFVATRFVAVRRAVDAELVHACVAMINATALQSEGTERVKT